MATVPIAPSKKASRRRLKSKAELKARWIPEKSGMRDELARVGVAAGVPVPAGPAVGGGAVACATANRARVGAWVGGIGMVGRAEVGDGPGVTLAVTARVGKPGTVAVAVGSSGVGMAAGVSVATGARLATCT